MEHPAQPARPGDRFDWLLDEAPRRPRSRGMQALGRPAADWALEAARAIAPHGRLLEITGAEPLLHDAAAASARSYVCLLAPGVATLPAPRGPGAVYLRGRPEDLAAAGRQFDAIACWDREFDDAAMAWADRLAAPSGTILVRRTAAAEAAWERRGWTAVRLMEAAEGPLALLRRRREAAAAVLAASRAA